MRPPIAILFMVLALLVGAARAQPDLQALAKRYETAVDNERWREVVRIGEQIMEQRPDLAVVPYNLACAHAQLGSQDEAIRWLGMAAENGYGGIVSIQTDPDLDPIREHDGFAPIEAKVQAARDERFGVYCDEARATEMIIVAPEGLDAEAPAPLIVALHGHGGRADNFVEVYRKAAADLGAVLVVPSALRPAGNGGFSWTFRDESEWMVMHAIERARAEHTIDAGRIVLTGFSMGANTTLEVGLNHPELFAGLIPVCGHWDEDVMRIGDGEDQPRVKLMIGARDPWAKTFREAQKTLTARGVESKLRVYQGVGHGYPTRADEELGKALRFVLGGASDKDAGDDGG